MTNYEKQSTLNEQKIKEKNMIGKQDSNKKNIKIWSKFKIRREDNKKSIDYTRNKKN